METRSTRLPNGMTVWGVHVPGQTVTAMFAFPAGARYETEKENGLAHFLEHMVFKGGQKWTDYRMVNRGADELGASMNAFTSHDMVAFYIKSRAEDAETALDLLSDFVGRPHLDAEELERERGVIVQEIAMYADRPSSVANELLDVACYGDHPLGRSVLGRAERIQTVPRSTFEAFRARTWSTQVGGLFLVGDLDRVPEFERLAEFGDRFPAVDEPVTYEAAPPVAATVLVKTTDSQQSHLRLHYPLTIEYRDDGEQAALTIAKAALGGSMSSFLFDEIREQRGLCYSIGAYTKVRPDDQGVVISSGLDSDKCVEAYGLIGDIVAELPDRLTDEAVDRARRYSLGQRAMALESTTSVARSVAAQHLDGETPDLERAARALGRVSNDHVREMASRLSHAAVAVVGPHEASDFGG